MTTSLARPTSSLLATAALIVALSVALAACQSGPPARPTSSAAADVVLRGGKLWTGDTAHPTATALAIQGGRIIAVGTDEEMAPLTGPHTLVKDLHGQMVLPGFHDAHVHPLGAGRQELGCPLAGLDSVQAIQKKIGQCAAATQQKGGFVFGRGWNLSLFQDANPNKKLLDDVVADRPAYFRGEDGHSGWANSKALALAGITKATPNPDGGIIERDAQGEPSGTLRESAVEAVEKLLPEPTVDDDLAAMRLSLVHLGEAGITSIMDAGTDDRRLDLYKRLADSGELTVRVVSCFVVDPDHVDATVAEAEALRTRYSLPASVSGLPLLRPTCAKIYLDGVLEGETAALQQPYTDHPETSGHLNAEPPVLNSLVTKLEHAGFQVHMHVIGDRAVHVALDAYAASAKENGAHDLRPTLAHIQLVDPIDYPRFAPLGVIANAQAFWAYPDSYIRDINTPQVGAARVERMYPFGSLHKAGAHVVGGSDWPVSSLAPLDAIEVMRTRQDPAQNGGPVLNAQEALDIDTALRAFTSEGAFLMHQENDVGVLAVGKVGDVVVVDHDLTAIAPAGISESHVVLTIMGGRITYERK